MTDGMLILPVEPVDGPPEGFRQGFGYIRPENDPTLTEFFTFAN